MNLKIPYKPHPLQLQVHKMKLIIPYVPHKGQLEVHQDRHRFRILAAGRRYGKTILAINELIRQAIKWPNKRSWYVAPTYRQVETIAWRDPSHSIFKFLPPELMKSKSEVDLTITLTNGHLIEFKGADKEDRLRGVGLKFVVLDEYGFMKPNVWQEIIEPMLSTERGEALFIGTPDARSEHFYDLYNLGLNNKNPEYKSWLFHSIQNPYFPKSEIDRLKNTTPPDIFKREYEADFTNTRGLVYNNFKHGTHVIPRYVPTIGDLVVCSIDPGLRNPTAALWGAWDLNGTCRLFEEYYETEKTASENAKNIHEISRKIGYPVMYYIVDRSSTKRDQTSGMTVYDSYLEAGIKPLLAAPNDDGSVRAGIDEVKKLFHVNPETHLSRMYVGSNLHNFINEINHYIWYDYKWLNEKNPQEKTRKLHDHLMDALRNMVLTRPWLRRQFKIINPLKGLRGPIY